MLTFYDKLLLYGLIVVGALTVPATAYLAGAETGPRYASVSVGGREVQRFALPHEAERYEIPAQGNICILEIRGTKLRMAESDCPKKLCIARGWIDQPGESIVCLPHRVVVKISGQSLGRPDSITR